VDKKGRKTSAQLDAGSTDGRARISASGTAAVSGIDVEHVEVDQTEYKRIRMMIESVRQSKMYKARMKERDED
jgi:hypothetical protein